MRRLHAVVSALALIFLFCGNTLPALAQLPPPPAATPDFKERPFGPKPPPTQAPAAKPKDVEVSKPIPLGWKIGGGIAWLLAIAGLLYWASQAWHSSNLFEQQHRFPTSRDAALRFGGKRSGGHMATLQFGESDRRRAPQTSEAEKA